MSPDAVLTLCVVAAALVVMAREWLEPALALGCALGVVVVGGVLEPRQALSGFASPAVAVVGLFLVLAHALSTSPWSRALIERAIGERAGRRGLVRIIVPVAALSAFVANTAVVAALIPRVRSWARAHGAPASKYLMPLSYAAVLGGACTLVGTSTNLVVDGLLREATGFGFSFFELGLVAGPICLAGLGYLVFVGYWLLPTRTDPMDALATNEREYVARLRVVSGAPLAGATVSALRQLPGVYLASIERGGRRIAARPATELHGEDVLIFVGKVDDIAELANTRGLARDGAEGSSAGPLAAVSEQLIEAVVSPSSPLVGVSIRDAGFRGRYDAAVLAVHRHGERLDGRLGDIVFHAGDTLLLLAGRDFLNRWRYARDFLLVSDARPGLEPDVDATVAGGRSLIAPAVVLAVVTCAALGALPLFHASVAGVLALIALRVVKPAGLWSALDWPTLVTLATAIGLGQALVSSGAAATLTSMLFTDASMSPLVLVLLIVVITGLLTEVVTNVAAAVLVFPLAIAAAETTGFSVTGAAVAVAIGASTALLTPIGYHTHTMVAGSAGYRFADFFRVGVGLKVVVFAMAAVLIPMIWG